MPAIVHQQTTGIDGMKTGIKTLRKSKLMTNTAYKTMFNVIEKHDQDVKLGHLTGKPKDFMYSAQKDSKFYDILSRMLYEVLQQTGEVDQKCLLQKVYLWYKSNRHVLACGPKFGKDYQRKEAEAALKQSLSPRQIQTPSRPKSHLIISQHTSQVGSERDEEVSQYPDSCDDYSSSGANSGIDLDLTTEVDYEEVLNRDSECDDCEQDSNMFIDVKNIAIQRPQETKYSSPVHFKGRKIQQPVSRGPQKMIHSIASLVNPHINTPRQVSGVSKRSQSGVVFRPITAPNTRADMLMTWQAFNKDRTYGQDIIGKMNFVGRSGTGLDVRYNAHELGEMPERHTKQVLKDLIKDGKKQNACKSSRPTDNVLTSQTLQEFYETADKFYPVKVPKFNVDVARSAQGRQRTPAAPLGRNLIKTERSESPNVYKSDIKLDTVVNMIDTVTDNMEFFKEKLVQPPSLGFRKPAANDLPTTPTPILSTSNFKSSSISTSRYNSPVQPPPSAVPDTPTPIPTRLSTSTPLSNTPLPGIDWRSKITPDPVKYRSKNKFGGHTYVRKCDRPSLRSAGSISAGHRPKTAPGNMKNKWKTERDSDLNERVSAQASSHMTTSVDQSALDDMMVIQHLVGDSASQEGSMYDFDMDFYRKMRRMNNSGASSTNQPLEYVSLLASGQKYGEATNRSVSAPVGQISKAVYKCEDTEEKMCLSPVAFSSIGEYDEGDLSELDEELKHLQDDRSVVGDQNMDNIEVTSKEEYSIKISAIPSEGAGPLPANQREQPLQSLTISDAWQFSTEGAFHRGSKPQPLSRSQSAHSAISSNKGHNSPKLLGQRTDHSKQSIKTESYNFENLPENPASVIVERSAGRMPGNAINATSQLMQMAHRQKASLYRAPPIRTPPSIPSPYNTFGTRSPRVSGRPMYQKELEDHARRIHNPRRFMEHVTDLREGLRTAPAYNSEEKDLMGMLQVHQVHGYSDYPQSILKPQSATAYIHYEDIRRPVSSLDRQVTFGSTKQSTDDVDCLQVTTDQSLRRKLEGDIEQRSQVIGQRSRLNTPGSTLKSLARIGRPIPQIQQIADPDDVVQAAILQKQIAAAVDIQRIFRGYVVRSNYKLLIKEVREGLEDARKAALQIQRHYRGHLSRKAAICQRNPNTESLEWARQYKQVLQQKNIERQEKQNALKNQNNCNYFSAVHKLEEIGPHVEIYQVYHPKQIGASRKELHDAAIIIQKLIRGWLIRRKLDRLKRKATCYGSAFPVMLKDYKRMLIRVQRFHGVEKFKTPFSISEMNSYMDNRKRYESVFERRAFGGEIEACDVEQYFKECDLYPSHAEIDDAREIICRKPGHVLKKEKGISKQQILDMLYYIYVPTATGLTNTRTSTWMNPIIDGQEAKKLIGSHLIEPAPLEKCAELVIEAKRLQRERKKAKMAILKVEEKIEEEK